MGHSRYQSKLGRHVGSWLIATLIMSLHYTLLLGAVVVSLAIPPAVAGLSLWILVEARVNATHSYGSVFMLTIMVGAGVAEFLIIMSYMKAIAFLVRPRQRGAEPCPEGHEVWRIIHDACDGMSQSGAIRVRFDKIELTPGAEVETISSGFRCILVMGWVLIRHLPREHLHAVLMHELAHYHGSAMMRHRATSRVVESYRRLRSGMDEALDENRIGHDSVLSVDDKASFYYVAALTLPVYVTKLFCAIIRAVQSPEDRSVEFYCDRKAADLFGDRVTAEALLAVAELGFFWNRFRASGADIASADDVFGGFKRFYADRGRSEVEEKAFIDFITRGSDEHPSIHDRVCALGQDHLLLSSWSAIVLHGEEALEGEALRMEQALAKSAFTEIARLSEETKRRTAVRAVAKRLDLTSSSPEPRKNDATVLAGLAYLIERHCVWSTDWSRSFDDKIEQMQRAMGENGISCFAGVAQVILEHCALELDARSQVGDTAHKVRMLESKLLVKGKIEHIQKKKITVDRDKFGQVLFEGLYRVNFSAPGFYFEENAEEVSISKKE